MGEVKSEMHHLPSYSPNLNLTKKLWKILNVKYYSTAADSEFAIKTIFNEIDQHKDTLKSFIGNKFQVLS